MYEVQDALANAGVPCARVWVPPRPWPGGAAAVMSHIGSGEPEDPRLPSVRRAMATELARIGALVGDLGSGLPRSELPRDALFQPAHNALFDLGAPGGEWIDERARQAREVLDRIPENLVVMHTDFSGANVAVVGGGVTAIYDVDSVAVIDEMRCLASAAVHFTYRGDVASEWPNREEARAFVADYVAARGRPLDSAERARLDAGAIYAMAYSSRCEMSLSPAPTGLRERLRQAPPGYLS